MVYKPATPIRCIIRAALFNPFPNMRYTELKTAFAQHKDRT